MAFIQCLLRKISICNYVYSSTECLQITDVINILTEQALASIRKRGQLKLIIPEGYHWHP